jgi:hypothetical protein
MKRILQILPILSKRGQSEDKTESSSRVIAGMPFSGIIVHDVLDHRDSCVEI